MVFSFDMRGCGCANFSGIAIGREVPNKSAAFLIGCGDSGFVMIISSSSSELSSFSGGIALSSSKLKIPTVNEVI